MIPPPPAGFTADENEPEPDPPHLPTLGVFASARKWLSIVGAVVIAGGVVLLIGYALGRRSVLPHPGEEARLDSVNTSLAHLADSLRNVAAWEYAQRMILEQKLAAAPAVDVIRPGVVQITPRDPNIAPRVEEIPVEVTAALSLERQINASLRVELDAEHRRAEVEKARADSAQRSVVLARATRTPWVTAGLGGGRNLTARAWDVSADAALRLGEHWSIRADLRRALVRDEELRARVYAHREWRWP